MRPKRETIRNNEFAYFVSTQTAGRKPFFRHDRWARLMVSTINHYAGTSYILHAFIIMPDHLHLLISPLESVEKSIQLIKGGFSFRAKRQLERHGEIWQQGFTDHRIRDEEDWSRHLEYIRTNPIEDKLAEDIALYEFMGFPNVAFPRGLKPGVIAANVRAEARTLQSNARSVVSNGEADAIVSNGRADVRTLQSEADSMASNGAAQAAHFQSSRKIEDQEAVKKYATQK